MHATCRTMSGVPLAPNLHVSLCPDAARSASRRMRPTPPQSCFQSVSAAARRVHQMFPNLDVIPDGSPAKVAALRLRHARSCLTARHHLVGYTHLDKVHLLPRSQDFRLDSDHPSHHACQPHAPAVQPCCSNNMMTSKNNWSNCGVDLRLLPSKLGTAFPRSLF
jgi:hypothetical protein